MIRMNCETCTKKQAEPVPRAVHEADMARMERANRRQLWIIILLILTIAAGVVGFVIREDSFETVVTTEIEQDTGDGSGNNYIVGGDFNGETARQDYENPDAENGR